MPGGGLLRVKVLPRQKPEALSPPFLLRNDSGDRRYRLRENYGKSRFLKARRLTGRECQIILKIITVYPFKFPPTLPLIRGGDQNFPLWKRGIKGDFWGFSVIFEIIFHTAEQLAKIKLSI